MNYASIVPLIGGETIAMEAVFNKRPEYILSYEPFANNDAHLVSYYDNKIPYHVINPQAPTSFENVDVINTVCPCAGLSTLSPSSASDNAANDWMVDTANYVLADLKPKVFWGENAPGLATKMGKPVVERLRKIADSNGYTMSLYKTQSKLHGLCQTRNRSFYFFWKGEDVPVFEYYSREQKSFEDTVRSAATNDPDDEMWLTPSNLNTPSDNPFYKYILDEIHDGITHAEFQRTLEKSTGVHEYIEATGRDYKEVGDWMSENGYSKEASKCYRMYDKLAAGGNIMRKNTEFGHGEIGAFVGHKLTHITHPDADRYLNIRECLHIMGLPKDFTLLGGRKNINHIAQNVPVSTAIDMAENVKSYLMGECKTIETPFLIQCNKTNKIEHYESTNSLADFM